MHLEGVRLGHSTVFSLGLIKLSSASQKRCCADQPALQLKRFNQDRPIFHADNSSCRSSIISKGQTRKVPTQDLGHSNGEMTYISPHGVHQREYCENKSSIFIAWKV